MRLSDDYQVASAGPLVVANSDGAARGNPGPAGIGVVLSSGDGTPARTFYKYIGIATNNEAEYRGAIAALEMARESGAQRIILRTDSELVARQLAGQYKVKSQGLAPLYRRARDLLAQFKSSTVIFIPREQNRQADALANRAIDEATRR